MKYDIPNRLKDWAKTQPYVYDWLKSIGRNVFNRTDPAYDFFDQLSKSRDHPINFLQIGASDGLRNDPIREFILRDSWSGVLVEPLPGIYDILKRNYAGRPDLKLINAAVSSGGTQSLELWTFAKEYLRPLTIEQQLDYLRKASVSKEHVMKFLPDNVDETMALAKIRVPCISINKVFRDYFLSKNVDLLVIDAEGHEKEIIESIDFDKIQPSTIFYESHNLGPGKEKLEALLSTRGYITRDVIGDTVATRILTKASTGN